MKSRDRLRPILHKVFGLDRLRPGQREVIENVLARRDTLAIMPTGAGKSLCYQLPALQMKGTTVVVSPLISLMKDQADKLEAHGIEAATLNSAQPQREQDAALRELRARRAEFVFATPERLSDADFIAQLKRTPLDVLVVDEAHCISEWGHDFRPAYLQIGAALRALGDPPVLALTATATPEVADDIRRHLGRPGMTVVNTGIYRANLRFAVRQVTNEDEKRAAILECVRGGGAGIVYASTVKAAEALCAWLGAQGENALLYHGRLPAKERHARQEAFMSGAPVMVATNAFGMGIDRPDLRFVVHYQLPGSLEEYYQEAGRAGRDGKGARCELLYDHSDRRVQLYFAGKRRREREKLETLTAYARSTACRWKMLLEYFGEQAPWPHCGRCDNCVRHAEAAPAPELHLRPERRLEEGSTVRVPRYGRGVVEAVADDRITVRFPKGPSRSFVPEVVRPI